MLQQLQDAYNDSLMLLLFHPQTILDGSLTGGKLPISIYESYYEPGSENADKGLQVDGWGMGRQLQMRFRQLPFEVETGEAEMIAVDFVAKGSGTATVQASATAPAKGKARAEQSSATSTDVQLSPEDEEGRTITHPLKRYLLTRCSHVISHRKVQRNQDAAPAHQPHQSLPGRTPTFIPHRRLHPRRPQRPPTQPPTPPQHLIHALPPTLAGSPNQPRTRHHHPRRIPILPHQRLVPGAIRRPSSLPPRIPDPLGGPGKGNGLKVLDRPKGQDGQEPRRRHGPSHLRRLRSRRRRALGSRRRHDRVQRGYLLGCVSEVGFFFFPSLLHEIMHGVARRLEGANWCAQMMDCFFLFLFFSTFSPPFSLDGKVLF